MKNLEEQFKNNPKIRKLIPESSHLIIAISGGLDSVVLTHILLRTGNQFKYTLTLAHVNHGLRENADRDMTFVQNLSDECHIPCEVVRLNPQMRKPNESVEAWARSYRYEALEKIRRKVKGDYILTAHHKYDQAETILMRLAQGTSGKGFKGIHEDMGRIRRPLLPFTKYELEEYAHQYNLSYVEDETNSIVSIPRNFIRHKILSPWIKQDNHVVEGIIRTSHHISELVDTASFTVDYFHKKLVQKKSDSEELTVLKNELNFLPFYTQLELIRKCMALDTVQWRQHEWDSLKSFLRTSKTGDVFSNDSDWCILNNRKEWIVFRTKNIRNKIYDVFPDGKTVCGTHVFNWEWVSNSSEIVSDNRNFEFIDGGIIQNRKLVLRHWENGDRFQPLGMRGWKKVSDFLIDEKVKLHHKNKQMVLTADGKIVWICGYRISNWVKVTPETTKLAKISLGVNQ